uniref:Uncharacterized protein n=1 Tax=Acrobeloides nanus TaxID=290746 RepID=A0A914DIJ0_9BILA
MSSTEKLEELRANMHQQLDLILQSMKAITQDETESKRFIMEALQKYFGSTALQAKVSKSSSSIFSRLEYPQEKELKPKIDAFGRMRPIDDDDDYGLPFVNKKGGSLGMKSATSSNDEDLLLTHNPFGKGPQLGVKIPSPPSRSGFTGDSSKESFSAIKTSMKPYYSSRGERTYQNSTRGRSGARQRSRGGREFENRGARAWENR